MRRKPTQCRMALRGRTGFLAYLIIGTLIFAALYYAWNSVFPPAGKIAYSSHYEGHGRMELNNPSVWQRQQRQQEMQQQQGGNLQQMQQPLLLQPSGGNAMPQPPGEEEADMQAEMDAKVLQDRKDEVLIAQEKAKEEEEKQKVAQTQQQSGDLTETLFQAPQPEDGDYFRNLERLVHLDLKGAPPLVSYLESLFPVFRSLGATGLLMEYEDMFPFTGNLSILAAENAYSLSDITRIQSAAKQSGLDIVPLVQTFGHMEFVLKHKRFMHLRENDYTPQVISPVIEDSYKLINDMIGQILNAHPDAKRVHLGCDEVYGLGEGLSHTVLVQQHIEPKDLFLRHVVRVASVMKNQFRQVKPLIWDDWIRKTSEQAIKESDLPSLVEPMVWMYTPNILKRIPLDVWAKYGRLFPGGLWVASAFKGATGAAQYITNTTFHLQNNLHWVSLMRDLGRQKHVVNFRGVALTGWQRFDHFATLCEILPVGLPSLALCLQAVQSGGFSLAEHKQASKILRCSAKLDLGLPQATVEGGVQVTQDCGFPGSQVFYGVQQLYGVVSKFEKDRGLQDRILGWLTNYNIRHGFSSPGQLQVLIKKLFKLIDELKSLVSPMREHMLKIYDVKTVDEWVEINIEDRLQQLTDIMLKAKALRFRKTWGSRYQLSQSTQTPQNVGSQVRVFQVSRDDNIPQQVPPVNDRSGVQSPVQAAGLNSVPQGPQTGVFNNQRQMGQAPSNSNFNPAAGTNYNFNPAGTANNFNAGVNANNNFNAAGNANNLNPAGSANNFNPAGSVNNFNPAGNANIYNPAGPGTRFKPAGSINNNQAGAYMGGSNQAGSFRNNNDQTNFRANDGSVGGQQGGRLSDTLLRKPIYPSMPSGPGKLSVGDSAPQMDKLRANTNLRQQQPTFAPLMPALNQDQLRAQFLEKFQQRQGGVGSDNAQNRFTAQPALNRGNTPEGPAKEPSYSQIEKGEDSKLKGPGIEAEKDYMKMDRKPEGEIQRGELEKTDGNENERGSNTAHPQENKQDINNQLKFEKEADWGQQQGGQNKVQGHQMLESFVGRGKNLARDMDDNEEADAQTDLQKAPADKDYKDYEADDDDKL